MGRISRYGENVSLAFAKIWDLNSHVFLFTELERSLSNSLLNLEASNAELEKFKLERAQLQAQLQSVSVSRFLT